MSRKIEEPNVGLYTALGAAIGTGIGTIVGSLTNFLIKNALVEAISLIKFLMILRMLVPITCVLTAYAIYRRKYKLYMEATFPKDIPTDF